MRFPDVADQLLDLFFPAACVGCGKGGEGVICRACFGRVSRGADGVRAHAVDCRLYFPVPGTDRVRHGGEYSGLLKEMVLRLKSSYRQYAHPLARLMLCAAGNDPSFIAPDLICCVPSSRGKTRQRGYNPPELLARLLASLLGSPYTRCLIKLRRTLDQDGLSASERLVNVENAFGVKAGLAPQGRVLLIDDVLTTGATVSACALALREAGAREVNVLVAARAVMKTDLRVRDS